MTEAIFGLVGVVVGGFITGGAINLIERRTERLEARASARLLQSELRLFAHKLDTARDLISSATTRSPGASPAASAPRLGDVLSAMSTELAPDRRPGARCRDDVEARGAREPAGDNAGVRR
jgi:hypothetical protein